MPKNPKTFSFELIDLLGHSLLKIENQTKINISGISKGVYLGKIITDKHTVVRKVMIK
ncbi:T9SS type A sorting domain-containing protein [Chryseobacterium sp. Hurlbut01]|uniref:T9SS type A sorting domain-containing protein n=1 Tax=Chryseobacterium sp. Hurlbut01 TaxID=1681828 RepID=UPI001F1FEB9B|nr:T9SS type A sorting domain-containing protein [Chryseobacterium sp. Hurlbut01]